MLDGRDPLNDTANTTGKYVLDEDGEPVREPRLLVWAQWMETRDRIVLVDFIGQTRVSTIFLGLDFGIARLVDQTALPILWETMVFGSALDHMQRRYRSKLAALAGHMLLCDLVEHFGEPPRRMKKALKKFRTTSRVTRPGEARQVCRWYARMHAYEMRRLTIDEKPL